MLSFGTASALEKLGYTYDSAEAEYIPMTKTQITDEELVKKMEKLLDLFDDNDDVQNVYHNWDMPEDLHSQCRSYLGARKGTTRSRSARGCHRIYRNSGADRGDYIRGLWAFGCSSHR